MAIISLADRFSELQELTCDVCVIGAGMAGLVAALRLAGNGFGRVVVVESGGKEFDPAVHDLNQIDNPLTNYQHGVDGRYRGLGGSSSHWGGKLLPLSPSDAEDRGYVNEPAWPLKLEELDQYRREIEALFQIDGESYEEDAVELWDGKRRTPRGDEDFALRYPKWPADMGLQMNIWIEQLPHWENRLVLSDKLDSLGVPMARIEWRATDMEERTFRACVSRLQSYWHRHKIGRFCKLDLVKEACEQSVPITSLADDRNHPSGSTRMGVDPVRSVVRSDLRTHEVENLSVASASVFPSAGSANPTYAILQMAMHAADAITRRGSGVKLSIPATAIAP